MNFSTSVFEMGINKLDTIKWREWIAMLHSNDTKDPWSSVFPIRATLIEYDTYLNNGFDVLV